MTRWQPSPRTLIVIAFLGPLSVPILPRPGFAAADSSEFHRQIEADWLLQEEARARNATPTPESKAQADAAGGCDGIKNGKWGFHTGRDDMPWWQVDLGAIRPIDRIVICNRCDEVADRANGLWIKLSEDGRLRWTVYTHTGQTFRGLTDGRPLEVKLENQRARFVRIQLPGKNFLHLDEVEVFGPDKPAENLALNRPASQSSASPWSTGDPRVYAAAPIRWTQRTEQVLAHCRRRIGELAEAGVNVSKQRSDLQRASRQLEAHLADQAPRALYIESRWIQRTLALADPLLSFDAVLFVKRVPGSYSHMSDQHYGWWSRPGGGIHLLRDFKSDSPSTECLTKSFTDPGSFLGPMLSYDGTKVLFAWCRHYPHLAGEKNKLDKANVPEDAFYHVFEMNIDGTDVRQLTRGKYDDFDARYLPDGRIVFLSTRRGQFIQCGPESARQTALTPDMPDSYVRCGGGPERPVAVYTLHTMDGDGANLCAISPFENFEWTPSIAHDGSILYSRWDYVDRYNMPYMSLWSINPDGTNARIVYGNFTKAPHCTFEPRSVPDSRKIVFTASGHHAQTMGSLVLLDPAVGTEGAEPIVRMTPEVPFPEIEAWSSSYYANPWPLSERFHLVSWGCESTVREGRQRVPNGMGIYLFDAAGQLELLHRDPDITSACPIPLRPRKRPPVIAARTNGDGPQEGKLLLVDVYRGLKTVGRGEIQSLRIVAVPAKTHPTMNRPAIGITHDDPGKCVLGTVPVEADGSAYFRVPAGVILFFQALDARGMAVQTMRSTTHVQPGQTLSCIGCHETRDQAPPPSRVLATTRPPSKIAVGPDGSWPLRFDRLVQPVLDRHCVGCHGPEGENPKAAAFDLSPAKAYETLVQYGKPSLHDHVWAEYRQGFSTEGACAAKESRLLAELTRPGGHFGVTLDAESLERLIVWMDTYAQKAGSFSANQEQRLEQMRRRNAPLLVERGPNPPPESKSSL